MNRASPTVSVVIATYDRAPLIVETLESVLRQTYPAAQVIVVNDGSTDHTADVLRPYADAGRILYIEQLNGGVSAARNRGLQEVTGTLVAFLDDDDTWPEDKLAWQVDLLTRHPSAVLAYGGFIAISEARHEVHAPPHQPSGSTYKEIRIRPPMMSPGQALMRTAAVRAAGGFDPSVSFCDDWELCLRLAQLGPFVYEPRPALHYRIHENASVTRALSQVHAHFRVVRRHIGPNLPLLVRHLHAVSGYYSWKLGRFARSRRRAGDHGQALRADLYRLLFRPRLLVRRGFVRAFAASLLRAAKEER